MRPLLICSANRAARTCSIPRTERRARRASRALRMPFVPRHRCSGMAGRTARRGSWARSSPSTASSRALARPLLLCSHRPRAPIRRPGLRGHDEWGPDALLLERPPTAGKRASVWDWAVVPRTVPRSRRCVGAPALHGYRVLKHQCISASPRRDAKPPSPGDPSSLSNTLSRFRAPALEVQGTAERRGCRPRGAHWREATSRTRAAAVLTFEGERRAGAAGWPARLRAHRSGLRSRGMSSSTALHR